MDLFDPLLGAHFGKATIAMNNPTDTTGGTSISRQPRLLVRNARVLTLDDDGREYEKANILIDDGRIESLGPDVGANVAAERIIDAAGLLALPGLVNSHFHSPGNLRKGAVPSLPVDLFMLYAVPPFSTDPSSQELAYLRTSLGALEMLKQGVTCVHDDAGFAPLVTTSEVTGIMEAYRDAGMRAAVALDQANKIEYQKHVYLREYLPAHVIERMETASHQSDGELIEFYQAFIERWSGDSSGRISPAVACSAPQRVTASYFRQLSEMSLQYRIPYDMHVLETRAQRVFGDVVHGHSLMKYAEENGGLHEYTQVIHAIWIDEEDIELLARRHCSVAHNPISNLKTGSGIMPLRRLLDAGVNVGIGTDEAVVDDGVNYWTAMKIAGLIHNVAAPDYHSWPSPDEILRAATVGGFRSTCPMQKGGQLTPGCVADIILLDLDTLPFIPLNDLKRQLVYCQPSHSVQHAIVGGEVVMFDRVLTTVDEKALFNAVRELSPMVDALFTAVQGSAQDLMASYEAAYWRQLDQPVPMQRWAGPMEP